MAQRDVRITTADGTARASLHVPDEPGPHPAVLMYPDAGGLRDTMRQMGDHLAALGYVTLIPDVYYRHGDWAPLDMRTAFADPDERARMMGMVRSITPAMAAADAVAFADYVLALPEVGGDAVGTTGYCMGGRLSMIVAAALGDRVAAAASFHGGGLASAEDPGSPHRNAGAITATVYVAGATNDRSFPDEQRDRLEAALTAAGVRHTIETYPAAHGFTMRDNPAYDAAAEARHWEALEALYGAALR